MSDSGRDAMLPQNTKRVKPNSPPLPVGHPLAPNTSKATIENGKENIHVADSDGKSVKPDTKQHDPWNFFADQGNARMYFDDGQWSLCRINEPSAIAAAAAAAAPAAATRAQGQKDDELSSDISSTSDHGESETNDNEDEALDLLDQGVGNKDAVAAVEPAEDNGANGEDENEDEGNENEDNKDEESVESSDEEENDNDYHTRADWSNVIIQSFNNRGKPMVLQHLMRKPMVRELHGILFCLSLLDDGEATLHAMFKYDSHKTFSIEGAYFSPSLIPLLCLFAPECLDSDARVRISVHSKATSLKLMLLRPHTDPLCWRLPLTEGVSMAMFTNGERVLPPLLSSATPKNQEMLLPSLQAKDAKEECGCGICRRRNNTFGPIGRQHDEKKPNAAATAAHAVVAEYLPFYGSAGAPTVKFPAGVTTNSQWHGENSYFTHPHH